MNPWNDPQIRERKMMERGSKELLEALCKTYPSIERFVLEKLA